MSATYNASSVKVLSTLDSFREKIGMYCGSAGLGLDDNTGVVKTVFEIFDNSIDEALNGYASEITIAVSIKGNKPIYTISDDGRGIPVDAMPDGRSALEVLLTEQHAGGKMSGNKNYKSSGGTNGIGASMVNALSEVFRADVYRDNKKYSLIWKDGIKTAELACVPSDRVKTGTTISFIPNIKYFTETDTVIIPFEKIYLMAKERAFLNDGVKIILKYEGHEPEVFNFKNGMAAFLADTISSLGTKSIAKNSNIYFEQEAAIKNRDGGEGGISARLIFGYVAKGGTDTVRCFTNMIEQREGGTHNQGFKMGIGRPFIKYINDNKAKYLKGRYKAVEPNASDVLPGLVAIIATTHSDPIYSGQDKNKLKSTDMQGFMTSTVSNAISNWFETADKSAIDAVIGQILKNAYLRKASDSAVVRVNKDEQRLLELGRAEKLSDCISKENNEIIFVEGDSAAGTAKSGRDRNTQAIMPISGKITNIHDEINPLKSQKVRELLAATGLDVNKAVNNSDSIKYDRIILLPDADSDGQHITCLLLTVFKRVCPDYINEGRLYIAIPPLYRITGQKGSVSYCVDKTELNTFLSDRAYAIAKKNGTLLGIDQKIISKTSLKRTIALDSQVTSIREMCKAMMIREDVIDSFMAYIAYKVTNNISLNTSINEFKQFVKEANPKFYTDMKNGCFKGVVNDGVLFFTENQLSGNLDNIIGFIGKLIAKQFDTMFYFNGKIISILQTFDILSKWYNTGISVNYLKGLGEMTAEQLRETTLDYNKRRLYQVQINDPEKATESFDLFMGDAAASVRFRANRVITEFS